ncbi:T9SS type A sorting domain-containing protein [Brumimicrobium mesophilum]|uniref:T9SS type A sorting domain-containing protein n=1 Tax=Brumimicrobium mesophilum TaxID=392717 RepID=UPI00131B35EC|nr:T9SS type A sorting domain-containing protein [Brumimicrobium mesophilum]
MKLCLAFIFALLIGQFGFSQCNVSINASSNSIDCGDCFTLTAIGEVDTTVYLEDFNDATLEPWITVSPTFDYSNPCGAPLDGSPAVWMDSLTVYPRNITTQSFDFSTGGVICYEMKYGIQGASGVCEGPDYATEGVRLQYSIDNGNSWVEIINYVPSPFTSLYDQWDTYCVTIPSAAETSNTQIRWIQLFWSSMSTDFWGIDNISVSIPVDNNHYYDWFGDGTINPADTVICQNTRTEDYIVLFSNGFNDTCSATITIQDTSALLNVDFALASDTVCVGDIVYLDGSTSTGANTYDWSFNGATPNTSSGALTSIIYNSAGTYSIELAIGNDCNESDTIVKNIVVVSQANCTNSLIKNDTESLKIYYNSDFDRVVVNSKKTGKAYILNSSGQKLVESQLIGLGENSIDTKSLTNGIYILVFEDENSLPNIFKFVK